MATDVTGYRSDGGGLGQDQGVSDQLRKILTSKLPLLNSPGTVIENSLYYDVTSSSVSAVEMQETFAKDRIALSSTQFGSAPTAYIPSVLFAGSVFWVVQLPDIKYPAAQNPIDPAASFFYAPTGWGFNCLQSIIVYMGASSIAQIEIDGYSNFMIAMACCESLSKRNAVLQAAGGVLCNIEGANVGAMQAMPGATDADAAANGFNSIFRLNVGDYDAATFGAANPQVYIPMSSAIIPIRLPFSSLAALEKKLSFDTKLSTQPIQITLQTKAFGQCFLSGNALRNTGSNWTNSTLQLWQEELSDKSLSVRNELLAMPQFNVGYPFQYTQSIPFPISNGIDLGLGNTTYNGANYNPQQITMNITSIINSDLTTMLFMVTWAGRHDVNPVLVTSGVNVNVNVNQFCPLYGEKLTNMQLYLNGQRFFAFEEDIYMGATNAKQLDNCRYNVAIPQTSAARNLSLTRPGLAGFWTTSQGNIYELNMSRLRSIVCESHMQNTARFTNQTFQLVFNIERGLYYPGGLTTSQYATCVLHMAYEYNAVFLVGGDGGTTKLVTN
jgi:hypothetical protein